MGSLIMPSTPTTPCAQDHVILLLSTPDFEKPPAWLSENFNVLEGGEHTGLDGPHFPTFTAFSNISQGQPSRNKLIVFADGTYIELFDWIERPQSPNAWADKSPGLIDFALTSMPPSTAESLREEVMGRLKPENGDHPANVKYEEPKASGRTRKDGVTVKWKLTRPVPASRPSTVPPTVTTSGHRQDLPFFTHDVTERNVRIPFDDKEKTTHPCGAIGISTIEVIYPTSHYVKYILLYQMILGEWASPLRGGRVAQEHQFRLRSPSEAPFPTAILARQEQTKKDTQWLQDRGSGIYGLRVAVQGREGHGVLKLGEDGIASSVFLEW